MSEQMYCIVYSNGKYPWYSYVKKKNINEIAKYINDRIEDYKKYSHGEVVREVYATEDYNDNKKIPVFFPTEYQNQHFFETYEERLLEQHRLEQLLV